MSFNALSYIDSSNCATCDLSCYECTNGTLDKCLSCDKDKYLILASTSVTYGTCEDKEKYGTFSFTLYVNAIGAANWNPTPVQSIDGTETNAFNYIIDAITKAYEMSAPFKEADMTIILKTGVHVMKRDNIDYYMPTRMDKWS